MEVEVEAAAVGRASEAMTVRAGGGGSGVEFSAGLVCEAPSFPTRRIWGVFLGVGTFFSGGGGGNDERPGAVAIRQERAEECRCESQGKTMGCKRAEAVGGLGVE